MVQVDMVVGKNHPSVTGVELFRGHEEYGMLGIVSNQKKPMVKMQPQF